MGDDYPGDIVIGRCLGKDTGKVLTFSDKKFCMSASADALQFQDLRFESTSKYCPDARVWRVNVDSADGDGDGDGAVPGQLVGDTLILGKGHCKVRFQPVSGKRKASVVQAPPAKRAAMSEERRASAEAVPTDETSGTRAPPERAAAKPVRRKSDEKCEGSRSRRVACRFAQAQFHETTGHVTKMSQKATLQAFSTWLDEQSGALEGERVYCVIKGGKRKYLHQCKDASVVPIKDANSALAKVKELVESADFYRDAKLHGQRLAGCAP